MIHHRVKVYDERTGDPTHDNTARQKNAALNRVCRNSMRIVTPRGRRRKKILTRIEYTRYVHIVAAVADTRHDKGCPQAPR